MLGTWVLSLGVFCMLQCSASGEPHPDFALHETLFGTVRVSGSISDTQLVVADIDANLYIVLNSTYPGLLQLLQLTQEVGERVSILLEGVLTPLETLAPSRDSEEVELFDDVLSEIAALQSFTSERLVAISAQIEMTWHEYIPLKLEDVFCRVVLGLQELSSALEALKTAVRAVLDRSSEEMSAECPPKAVRPKLVYRVVYAVRTLRAYLPAITYTLTTTVENIALADRFIVRLSEEAEDVQDPMQYINLVLATTNMVASAVSTSISMVVAEFGMVTAELSQLTNLSSLMAYAQVTQVVTSFNNVLSQLGTVDANFNTSLTDIAEHLALVLEPDEDTPMVDNAEVVATLVKTLVSSGPYARFCFYKFSELLFGLANSGLIGVEECISREIRRLNHLRVTLQEQAKLLVFDLEDFTTELGECNRISNMNRREACVVGYYTNVANSFTTKFNNLYSTGVAEATSSKNRLAACVKVLQFKIVDGTSKALNAQIQQCALTGPVVLAMEEP
uniref:Protein TsetseEP domain-containing protein n=1 Tax=Anopheles christyi TaxID=43041 RepID=A0A182JTR9_9DIPT